MVTSTVNNRINSLTFFCLEKQPSVQLKDNFFFFFGNIFPAGVTVEVLQSFLPHCCRRSESSETQTFLELKEASKRTSGQSRYYISMNNIEMKWTQLSCFCIF